VGGYYWGLIFVGEERGTMRLFFGIEQYTMDTNLRELVAVAVAIAAVEDRGLDINREGS
jgi:hypothetical protein